MGKKRAKLFLRESVILFGFLNGLFLGLGVNPGATILAVVAEILESLTGGNGAVRLALTLLPLALVAFALYSIHKRAGWLGFVAVGIAFLAGLWILPDPLVGTLTLLAALVLGYAIAR